MTKCNWPRKCYCWTSRRVILFQTKVKMYIIRGDTYNIPMTFTNNDWTEVDLTWCVVFFTAKPKWSSKTDDTDAVISKTISVHTDPTHWKTTLILSSADTDIPSWEYIYDCQLKTSWGDIHSTQKDVLIVENDITKRIV